MDKYSMDMDISEDITAHELTDPSSLLSASNQEWHRDTSGLQSGRDSTQQTTRGQWPWRTQINLTIPILDSKV